MELILVLPLLFLVLMAVFELSLLFFARASVVQASRQVARQVALGNLDPESLDQFAQGMLSPALQQGRQMTVVPAARPGELSTVILQVPMASAAPDLLWPIGFSLENQYLTGETTVVRE